MTLEELQCVLLARQHLTDPAAHRTVTQDMLGLQCQFFSCAQHALRIRTGLPFASKGLVKNWTLRGTIHLFDESDLPLFLAQTATRTIAADGFRNWRNGEMLIAPDRYQRFCCAVLQHVQQQGIVSREALKDVCRAEGMTPDEEKAMFDPWGGGIRDLCQRGLLNHCPQEKKAFQCCPPFTPMAEEAARLALLQRYLLHYAPATVRDAAYFFGWPQRQVRDMLAQLGASTIEVAGSTRYYLGKLPTHAPATPACILLAGFDPLMLGYQKLDSLFLPPEHLRGIFHLAGIVHPAILLHGRVVGHWQRKGSRVTFTLFAPMGAQEKRSITEAMERCMDYVKSVAWVM